MAAFIDRLAPAQRSLFPTETVIEAVLVHDIPGRSRISASTSVSRRLRVDRSSRRTPSLSSRSDGRTRMRAHQSAMAG